MLFEATALAVMVTAGTAMTFNKFPPSVQKFLIDHPLLTDVIVVTLTYLGLGFTILAHMASAEVALFITCLLYIAKHPEDFEYITDFKNACAVQLKKLQTTLNEKGREYRAEKAARNTVASSIAA